LAPYHYGYLPDDEENDMVRAPTAVLFDWHQLAMPNLGNREGLPASPFRTDRW